MLAAAPKVKIEARAASTAPPLSQEEIDLVREHARALGEVSPELNTALLKLLRLAKS